MVRLHTSLPPSGVLMRSIAFPFNSQLHRTSVVVLSVALVASACEHSRAPATQQAAALAVYQTLLDSCYLTGVDSQVLESREVLISERFGPPDTLYDTDVTPES